MSEKLRPLMHFFAAALVLSTASGCGADKDNSAAVTFADDVAPLIYRSCTPCHNPAGPAPFTLCSYEDAFKRRRKLAKVVQEGLMPPWLPTHGDFVGDRRLSNAEIAMLTSWAAGEGARGNAADEPACPEYREGWQLREPDLVVTFPEAVEVPADGLELFRNFVVPVPAAADRVVAAVEIRPGSPAVHHALLVVDSTGSARARDAADPELGFSGMDMAGAKPPDGYFLGWTPGREPRELPIGMGFGLPRGGDLVLQLHLTPTGKRETFKPRIGFFFRDQQPTVVSFPLTMFAAGIDLPAGAADVVVRDHVDFPVSVKVHSVYPHAHYLCSSMRAWATLPNGDQLPLFEISRWDFDWQDDYFYAESISLPAGSRVNFEYHYDNSADNPDNPSRPPVRVREGDRSTDEMANLMMQLTVKDLGERRLLGEAVARRTLEKRPANHGTRIELAMLLRELGRIDDAMAEASKVPAAAPEAAEAIYELGNCHLAAGRMTEAEQTYARCVQKNPGFHEARVILGGLQLQLGRHEVAQRTLVEAVRYLPERADLQSNLATAYLALSQLTDAERHYRLAIEYDPGLFQAWFNLGRIQAATGRAQDARRSLRRAQQLRPQDARVRQVLKGLGR